MTHTTKENTSYTNKVQNTETQMQEFLHLQRMQKTEKLSEKLRKINSLEMLNIQNRTLYSLQYTNRIILKSVEISVADCRNSEIAKVVQTEMI